MKIRDRECHSCKALDSIALHNVPYRGYFAFLCTGCVLRHRTGTFCPVCFDLYDDDISNKRNPSDHHDQSRVLCVACPAMAHLACLSSVCSSSPFRFICAQCSDPSFKFFDFGVDSLGSRDSSRTLFTRDLQKQLLCAAKISSVTMRRAASVARTNAEIKGREAVVARKRAKEAIERVSYLMGNQHTEESSCSELDGESSV